MHPGWPNLEVEVRGRRLADTWETAALQALIQFCSQHPWEVLDHPIGLLPTTQVDDIAWLERVDHMDVLGHTRPQETILTSMRCMNALFRLYQLQKEGLDLMVLTAQAAHLTLNARDEQIHELEQEMSVVPWWNN